LQIAVAETEKNAEKALAWMEGILSRCIKKKRERFLFYLVANLLPQLNNLEKEDAEAFVVTKINSIVTRRGNGQ
jgi:hypothetical protein